MMRLRLSLKNWVRRALSIFILFCLICGCSSSTKPTYLKENITQAVRDICKNEYQIDVKARLVGQTLWVYIPVEDIFIAADKKAKPEKYLERFSVEHNQDAFEADTLKLEYLIRPVPEKEEPQKYEYNDAVLKKINGVLGVLRRVLFSMDRSKANEPKFFCVIAADIKNGFQIKELFYYLDLKKVSYQFISVTEYQHRAIQDLEIVPQAIGDKEGLYINYKDITMREFIAWQIAYRIKLKFQKPEVEKNIDIDKEIIKVVAHTLRIYDFQDFSAAEFNNLMTNDRFILNRQAILASSPEE